MIKLTIYFT